MKASFESTTAFEHFRKVMKQVIAVPKERLDVLVQAAKEESPRKGDPDAPGKKRITRRASSRKKPS